MRIAYIAPYQGPALLKVRPIVYNLSLAGNAKILLISELLGRNGHEVEIISQGEVVENQFKFFPAMQETPTKDVPAFYASAWPVRRVNGFWSSHHTKSLFAARHRAKPFDLAIVYNLKEPQLACARYARQLGLPVILEYEDDAFVDVAGENGASVKSRHRRKYRELLDSVSGAMAVSPYLLSQARAGAPKLLLRGIVNDAIFASRLPRPERKNRVVFSGTHERTQGLEQTVEAWNRLALPGWELHIAGYGPITDRLKELAAGNPSIVFCGYLKREDNARLIGSAKIGLNPQDPTKTPGNVFALKIIEYLAAGLHVVTTPRGALEKELEGGITYIEDNKAADIGACLKKMIDERTYERTAEDAAQRIYGSKAIADGLHQLVTQAAAAKA